MHNNLEETAIYDESAYLILCRWPGLVARSLSPPFHKGE